MARPFNDTNANTGLIQLCEQNIFGDSFGQISGDTARLQIFANYINEGYNKYWQKAVNADGKWQFDDNNFTDYAIATRDLVSGQQDYPFTVSMVNILSIEVQNSGGIWYPLVEVDEQEWANDHISMTERFKIPSQPANFNRTANSIFLLPATNYNLAGGLKVKYQRPPNYFLYTDTTKVPGFAETMHEFLSDYATWKYAAARGMSIKGDFKAMVDQALLTDIPTLYLKREKDTTKIMHAKRVRRR